ncbi:hypothetical protein D3OALGA1CA_1811 [Olavius algarvensis associated proteobacterium Delta 3]|nr:hypothetical protein D3OALGA1CA_1811 [Olavius algarvensis associated proteobacterium Delta 3]CAB5136233.1 hypothetical protein D3OALGB2SA_3951 [Olavius algarvensis associated proteobacterium Delta 3]
MTPLKTGQTQEHTGLDMFQIALNVRGLNKRFNSSRVLYIPTGNMEA